MNSIPHATDPRTLLVRLLSDAVLAVAPGHPAAGALVFERPRDPRHGDFACNVAMQLAKSLRAKPRDIAQRIIDALPASDEVDHVEIAGAGFINIFLRRSFKQQVVNRVLSAAANYGRSPAGRGRKVQVEFVSANPTGPLHVGHGRGAAFGASLANVLEAAGDAVSREYYVNDAGRQMDILAVSTWLRYLQVCGERVDFPPNAYQGEYVRDMARQVLDTHGRKYHRPAVEVAADLPALPDAERADAEAKTAREAHLDALIARAKALLGGDYDYIHRHALNEQLTDCRDDLTEFAVSFDHWFSERSLFDSELVERAVATLEQNGHVYTQDGARWFRSTHFGDEKDRVVQRDNGQYTYFASDIAYHLNKFERGFDLVIDVWGADHHGYIPRVKGALKALGLDEKRLTVALVQFAVLYRNGEKASMSTRSGEFVTLRDLRREVGNDAARFFYVLRKSDQHLDFDLDLAKSRSNENPVYYIQYAHARIYSVLEQWGGDVRDLRNADATALATDQEMVLAQLLMDYPDTITAAARELSPHLIAFYLKDLAAEFHSYYNSTRFLVDDPAERDARLALATAVQQVIRNGLDLLGVSAPVKM